MEQMKDSHGQVEVVEKLTRKQQAEQTKQKLLDVSLRLIKEQGYDQVKISDICDEVGVSIGAFYHHLKNKAGIVTEAYTACDHYFEDIVYPKFKDRYDVEAICDYLDYQMQYAIDMGVDITIQMYKAQITEGTEFFLLLSRGLPKGLIQVINQLQEHNVFSNHKTAAEIGNEILVISRGILYNWCQFHGTYDLKQFNRDIVSKYIEHYII